MSRYELKPQKKEDTVSVGHENFPYPRFFIQINLDTDKSIEKEGTGAQIALYIHKYADTEDTFTKTILSMILFDLDPATQKMGSWGSWNHKYA